MPNFKRGHKLRLIAGVFLLIGTSMMLTGCAKKRRPEHWGGLVQGKITLDGQPLDGGTVTFIPLTSEEEGGRPGIAHIDPDGSYRVGNANPDKPQGLIPGRYKVTFLAMTPDPTQTGSPIAELRIPECLLDMNTTSLECDVNAGDNHFDFELASDIAKVAMRTR